MFELVCCFLAFVFKKKKFFLVAIVGRLYYCNVKTKNKPKKQRQKHNGRFLKKKTTTHKMNVNTKTKTNKTKTKKIGQSVDIRTVLEQPKEEIEQKFEEIENTINVEKFQNEMRKMNVTSAHSMQRALELFFSMQTQFIQEAVMYFQNKKKCFLFLFLHELNLSRKRKIGN